MQTNKWIRKGYFWCSIDHCWMVECLFPFSKSNLFRQTWNRLVPSRVLHQISAVGLLNVSAGDTAFTFQHIINLEFGSFKMLHKIHILYQFAVLRWCKTIVGFYVKFFIGIYIFIYFLSVARQTCIPYMQFPVFEIFDFVYQNHRSNTFF